MPLLPGRLTLKATDLRAHLGHEIEIDHGRDRPRSHRKGASVYAIGLWCRTCQDSVGPLAYYSEGEK